MKIEILAFGEDKPDPFSWCIQKFIKADYSHLGMLVDDKVLYHATTARGFCAQKYEDAIHDPHTATIVRHRIAFDLSEKEAEEFKAWATFRLGTRYSFGQYVGFFVPFLKFTCRNREKRTICSEIVAEMLFRVLGVYDNELTDADFLCPRKVIEISYRAAKARQ